MSKKEALNVFRNKFWKPIQETLDILTTKSPDEVKAWFVTERYLTAYTRVHACYFPSKDIVPPLSRSEIRGELFNDYHIYECLKMYMTEHFQKVSLSIESKKTQETAFICFLEAHLAFQTYRKLIGNTFNYIQHEFDSASKSEIYCQKVLSIEKLLISLWSQLVILPNLPLILIGAKSKLREIRELKLQENRTVDFISFISSYSQDQELPLCAIISEYLAQIYKQDLEAFIVAFASANKLTAELDVPKCRLIYAAWNKEMERVKVLFGKSRNLVRKYKKFLRERLLEPSLGSIEGIITDSLRNPQNNQSLVIEVYKIYSAYNVLHPRLLQLFEHEFTERVSSKSENDMAHILECTIWADSLLRDCFEENKDYIIILEKALRPIFSGNTGSDYTSMLAARIDKELRTQSVQIENSSEHRQLYALMTQLRFVEDKETLRANYDHFLALRLMAWRQQASDVFSQRIKIEKRVIERLGKICGSRLVENLNRMLADVENEKENAKGVLPEDMSSDTQVMILTGGSWPQAKSGWKESIWPEQLRIIYGVAASNYKERFSGRRLEWLPELSTVAVKMGSSLVTLSVVQYAFLSLLLQKGSSAPKAECLAYFDLGQETLASLIHGLMACGLVQTAESEFYINETALESFPPRVDLAFAVRNRIPQDNRPTLSENRALSQPVDYDALVQCHLVQISKKEGKKGRLLKTLLFQKTKDALSSRISLTDCEVEAQLKILIEMEYIKLVSKGKYIKYCP